MLKLTHRSRMRREGAATFSGKNRHPPESKYCKSECHDPSDKPHPDEPHQLACKAHKQRTLNAQSNAERHQQRSQLAPRAPCLKNSRHQTTYEPKQCSDLQRDNTAEYHPMHQKYLQCSAKRTSYTTTSPHRTLHTFPTFVWYPNGRRTSCMDFRTVSGTLNSSKPSKSCTRHIPAIQTSCARLRKSS